MSTEAETPDRRDQDSPPTLRLRDISAMMTVGDVDASLKWYRDIVGFHVQELWEHEGKVGGAALVAGSASIFLGQDDGAKGHDRVKGVGHRLILVTADDVDEVAAGIEARGGTLASPPSDNPWGRAFTLVDPDGFQITITSRPEEE
jgi:predicted enzyme related to lactoylglutathione lyase